jgi:exodeoxyribonuclease VII large subunit
LFDEHRKKALPPWPETVGIITSLHAAALRDVISVFRRRNAGIRLIVYPASVQGDMAKSEIISMLQIANAQNDCDALILCRGGGSIEDLSVFNDEGIARQIAASHIPIVSAIGHETDVTIADFVADIRAATPTAAAEMLSPCLTDSHSYFKQLMKRLQSSFSLRYRHYLSKLTVLEHRLLSPQQKIDRQYQSLLNKKQRLSSAMFRHFQQYLSRYQHCSVQIPKPTPLLRQKRHDFSYLMNNVKKSIYQTVNKEKNNIDNLILRLEYANPEQILSRGYSITYNQHGQVISDLSTVRPNDRIVTRLATGKIDSQVITLEQLVEKIS